MDFTDNKNLSFEEENVLANSIKMAREKFLKASSTQFDSDVSIDRKVSTSFTSVQKHNNNPAAGAIKILRHRIKDLENLNSELKNQNQLLKREIKRKNQEEIAEKNHEFSKENRENEQQISKGKKLLEAANIKIVELEKMLIEKENTHALKQKLIQIEEKEKNLVRREQILNGKSVTYADSISEARKVQKILEEKITQLTKRNDVKQNVITQLIKDLEQEKQKNKQNHSKHKMDKNSDRQTFPVIVEEPSLRKQIIESMSSDGEVEWPSKLQSKKSKSHKREIQQNKFSVTSFQNKNQIFSQELKVLKQKNEQLYRIAKNYDAKYKQSDRQKRSFKEKFYQLKTTIGDIIELINKLPKNISQQFKIHIVRINKLEGSHLQCLRSQSSVGYLRGSSRGSGSKQRSISSKPLKMEDLNVSDQFESSREKSHSKSRSRQRKRSIAFPSSHSGKKRGQKKTIRNSSSEEYIKKLKKQNRMKRKEILTLHGILNDEQNLQVKNNLQNRLNALMEEETLLKKEIDEHLRMLANCESSKNYS